ncbi:hypothetical protein VC83_03848 [Pseudogymnoascus destructans]|uniref:Uncharacterized protein n=1 Tax=Pseudogymnoascus destructans TaxID=655981 RepID=A0A177ADW8_9PEZI|nr:uncharacterized protein VC83_03848 [Pseudogymnoascus destructans]OAF59622.1 hypothetical protein VC83_03848 [Pseudogymnoascus destructans]
MARVTRSTKITISEDETSQSIPQNQHIPSAEARAPLQKITNTTEEIVSLEDAQIADEEKLLKAAFKTAIGIKKKNKRAKNKRNVDQEQSHDNEVIPDDQPASLSPATAATRELLRSDSGPIAQIRDELQATDLGGPEQDPMAVDAPNPTTTFTGRLTRSQMKGVQPGQYNYNSYANHGTFAPAVPSAPHFHYGHSKYHTGHVSPGKSIPPALGWPVPRWLPYRYGDPIFQYTNTDYRVAGQEQAYSHSGPKISDYVNGDGDVAMGGATRGSALHIEDIDECARDQTPEPKSSHDDSFVKHILGRSPAKPVSRRLSVEEMVAIHSSAKPSPRIEDSVDELDKFEETIIRSPAKPVSRIEDSLEELDLLEDIMEALTEAAKAQELASPVKSRKATPAILKSTRQPTTSPALRPTPVKAKTIGVREGKALMNEMMAKKAASGTSTVRSKQVAVKKSVMPPTSARSASAEPKPAAPITKRPAAKRPVSLMPPKEPIKSTKPPTRSTFELPGEAISRKLKEQREARIAQRQSSVSSDSTPPIVSAKAMAPKVKSTKAPSRPTFELPGEALSRKKRETYEACLKLREEEEKKRREFKAKPVRKSIAPSMQPRQTAASLARRSIMNPEDAGEGLVVSKRRSVIGVSRPSLTAQNLANTSASRTRVTAHGGGHMTTTAMSDSSQRSSSVPALVQKLSGRDIYKRDARALEGAERERKEKEAAAKKAREEAAEKGRQASREWATKQRRKMMEGKIPDEGLSAGYGPGGQLGLKG